MAYLGLLSRCHDMVPGILFVLAYTRYIGIGLLMHTWAFSSWASPFYLSLNKGSLCDYALYVLSTNKPLEGYATGRVLGYHNKDRGSILSRLCACVNLPIKRMLYQPTIVYLGEFGEHSCKWIVLLFLMFIRTIAIRTGLVTWMNMCCLEQQVALASTCMIRFCELSRPQFSPRKIRTDGHGSLCFFFSLFWGMLNRLLG